MGRGNWFPGNDLQSCEVAYVNYSDDSIEFDDYDAQQWRWDDVKDCIAHCLPDSFRMVDGLRDYPHGSIDRDSVPLAYNSLFTLWVDGQGESYHLGLGFTVNEGAPAFAASRLRQCAKAFFDRLSDSYSLSVRSCAWTSAPYRKAVTA
jgi:hypothetical protein